MTVVQKFYLHDASSTDGGTLPPGTSESATSPSVTAAGASTSRAMDGNKGSSQVGPTLGSGAVSGVRNCWFRRFVSAPVSAQVVASGTWQLRAAIKTSATAGGGAWQISAIVYSWRPSTGALVTTIVDAVTTGIGTAAGTSETDTTVATITASGSSVTFQNGDILVVEIWGTTSQTALSRTWTLYYDGTTEGSTTSNAAYLLAPTGILLPGGGGPLYMAA